MEHASLQERIAFLYDPDRLEARFRAFEAFTLPAMKAQTNDDFDFLIVIGETLAAPWRARLAALIADLPQARIVERAPGPHRKVMQDAINSVRRTDGPCLQFRMDDDDAVSTRYIEKLRATATDTRQLLRHHRHFAIDFNRGYIAAPGPDGISATKTETPLTTAGLAVMFRTDIPLSVMNFAHGKLGRHMPVLSVPDDDMMLRGHTGLNDSRQKTGVKNVPLTLLDAAGEDHFRKVFNIDANQVRSLFARQAAG